MNPKEHPLRNHHFGRPCLVYLLVLAPLLWTGLITALYSNGVLGPKGNSNAVPPVNTAVALVSAPSPAPSLIPDNDRYKALTGKWRVIEEPSQDPYFADVERIGWDYDAAVKDNVLTLKGKILFIDDVNDKPKKGEKQTTAKYETTLTGLSGEGKYRITKMDGSIVTNNNAKIQLEDGLENFEVKIDVNGRTYRLTGSKL
jgi:hypothetical protein